ncbi:MAG: multidrug efflux SMR transporter [Bosea sp.]|uniref:DMT family transporter n=1 Tax=Bosea sp. (in: a-proteobacteria) TaxID=1871050 RepID=UPI002390F7FB|nr:multidrug efflux SMR transporter [Bosea sp. (in: a-proteobacteria)]MCP4736752.1 multidrug efflux SMR transporter [Bosea sp. (in: a-proteobacteria)]
MSHAWLLLGGAIICEITAALALRFSDGFTKLWPTLLALLTFGTAFYLISIALKTLPVSIAYPVWAGSGTVGVALVGVLALRESLSVRKVAGVVLVVLGIVVLNSTAS